MKDAAPHVWYVPWIPGPAWIAGITIPPVGIFIERRSIHDQGLLNHECFHWLQYETRGFWRFVWDYWRLFLKYGYRNHPMEIQADAHRDHPNAYDLVAP